MTVSPLKANRNSWQLGHLYREQSDRALRLFDVDAAAEAHLFYPLQPRQLFYQHLGRVEARMEECSLADT